MGLQPQCMPSPRPRNATERYRMLPRLPATYLTNPVGNRVEFVGKVSLTRVNESVTRAAPSLTRVSLAYRGASRARGESSTARCKVVSC